jgi:hypothetical protein
MPKPKPDFDVFRDGMTPEPAPVRDTTKPRTKPQKATYTFRLPEELVERVKSAAYHTPGLTMSAIAEAALREILERLERDRGAPFPPLPEGAEIVSPGRPPKPKG